MPTRPVPTTNDVLGAALNAWLDVAHKADGSLVDAIITVAKFASGAFPGFLLQPWQSGRYYMAPNTGAPATSAAQGNNTLRALPFWIPNAVTLSRIGAEVTVIGDVGSKVRLGIYADDGTGRPGALLLDAGQIAGDSATVQEIAINLAIGPGAFWAAAVVQSAPTTQPTVRTSNNVPGLPSDYGTAIPAAGAVAGAFSQAGVAGALPGQFTGTVAAQSAARVFVKVA